MNLDKVIEFDKVKERWKELAVTEHAHEKIDNATYILSEPELRKSLKDTTDARELMDRRIPFTADVLTTYRE